MSRQAGDFDILMSLLVADRVKSTLSEACLRYILSVEAATETGWLTHTKLAKSIDDYNSNHLKDRPITGAIGSSGNKYGNMMKNTFVSQPVNPNSEANIPKTVKSTVNAGGIAGIRECFHCRSRDHLIKACPLRASAGRTESDKKNMTGTRQNSYVCCLKSTNTVHDIKLSG